ncbi:Glycine-rich domain-containing protein 1 [Fusarium oxysporum f. sp. albedinis]|nr:Glycine-rich domain-containing protein 1 [Fusarium oxysporum f. sp. albedinis]
MGFGQGITFSADKCKLGLTIRRFIFSSFDDSPNLRIYRLSLIANVAKCPVWLQFLFDKAVEGLSFNNPAPESLVTAVSEGRQESSFAGLYLRAILPFM